MDEYSFRISCRYGHYATPREQHRRMEIMHSYGLYCKREKRMFAMGFNMFSRIVVARGQYSARTLI